jgi:hypothetical protein
MHAFKHLSVSAEEELAARHQFDEVASLVLHHAAGRKTFAETPHITALYPPNPS